MSTYTSNRHGFYYFLLLFSFTIFFYYFLLLFSFTIFFYYFLLLFSFTIFFYYFLLLFSFTIFFYYFLLLFPFTIFLPFNTENMTIILSAMKSMLMLFPKLVFDHSTESKITEIWRKLTKLDEIWRKRHQVK
jgi:hypothetical protein